MKIIAIITVIGAILIFYVKYTEPPSKQEVEIAKLKDAYLKLGYHHVTPPIYYESYENCEYIKPSRASGYWRCH